MANLKDSKKELVLLSFVSKLVAYNSVTGIFTWVDREETSLRIKAWNKRYSGRNVGSKYQKGKNYLTVSFTYEGKAERVLLHRLAWFICKNEVPANQIDHINQVQDDNRIENLKVVSDQENRRNSSMQKNNTSGVTGVYWNKRMGMWVANCRINSKTKYLGCFIDIKEAEKIAKSFRLINGFSELHGKQK